MKRIICVLAMVAVFCTSGYAAETETSPKEEKTFLITLDKKQQSEVRDRLNNFSGDTWAEGDYDIQIIDSACYNGWCLFKISAFDVKAEFKEDNHTYQACRRLDFLCKARTVEGILAEKRYLPVGFTNTIGECISDNEYDPVLWELNGVFEIRKLW